MMKSIEKLREWSMMGPMACQDLLDIADEIEREIAERYMELPLDADGVPIHVGDEMRYHGGKPFTVCAVAPGVIHTWAAVKLGERSTTYHYAPDQCTHHKPRTLEDVLRDLQQDTLSSQGEYSGESIGVDEWQAQLEASLQQCADEIRELMEVDA